MYPLFFRFYFQLLFKKFGGLRFIHLGCRSFIEPLYFHTPRFYADIFTPRFYLINASFCLQVNISQGRRA